MKKRVVIILCVLLILCSISIGVSVYFRPKEKDKSITMTKWYDSVRYEDVINLNFKSINYSAPYECRAYIQSYSSQMIDCVKKSENYLGDYSFTVDGNLQEGQLIFKNNEYYFFYAVNDTYCVVSLMCRFIHNQLEIDFPMSCAMYCNTDFIPYIYEDIDSHFENRTFEKDKAFYSLFTEFVTIDELNNVIKILGNNPKTQEKYEVILDYVNRCISINTGTEILHLQQTEDIN
ncbi:hypothetical protein HDR67_01730 [bacterium]|nr:hypothetical protein [bacterium]